MEGGNFTIVSAIDARHGNVYFQTFGTDGRTIQGPRLSKVSEAASMLRKGPFRIAGSAGAALTLEVRLLSLSADPAGELQNPLIEFVARLGANADSARAPALPLYLKAAEAASQMLLKLDQG